MEKPPENTSEQGGENDAQKLRVEFVRELAKVEADLENLDAMIGENRFTATGLHERVAELGTRTEQFPGDEQAQSAFLRALSKLKECNDAHLRLLELRKKFVDEKQKLEDGERKAEENMASHDRSAPDQSFRKN